MAAQPFVEQKSATMQRPPWIGCQSDYYYCAAPPLNVRFVSSYPRPASLHHQLQISASPMTETNGNAAFIDALLKLYRLLTPPSRPTVVQSKDLVRLVDSYFGSTLYYGFGQQHRELRAAIAARGQLLRAFERAPDQTTEIQKMNLVRFSRSDIVVLTPSALLDLGYRIPFDQLAKALTRLGDQLAKPDVDQQNVRKSVTAVSRLLAIVGNPFLTALNSKHARMRRALSEWTYEDERLAQTRSNWARARIADRLRTVEQTLGGLSSAMLKNLRPMKQAQVLKANRRR